MSWKQDFIFIRLESCQELLVCITESVKKGRDGVGGVYWVRPMSKGQRTPVELKEQPLMSFARSCCFGRCDISLPRCSGWLRQRLTRRHLLRRNHVGVWRLFLSCIQFLHHSFTRNLSEFLRVIFSLALFIITAHTRSLHYHENESLKLKVKKKNTSISYFFKFNNLKYLVEAFMKKVFFCIKKKLCNK